MNFMGFLCELSQVFGELVIEVHYWFQVDLPQFFGNLIVKAYVFVANKKELIQL